MSRTPSLIRDLIFNIGYGQTHPFWFEESRGDFYLFVFLQPNVADWGGDMSACCTAGPTVR